MTRSGLAARRGTATVAGVRPRLHALEDLNGGSRGANAGPKALSLPRGS